MFLRRCERRKSGKRHTYWALVESYRTARGSRQRVVAYLGDLTPSEQDGNQHEIHARKVRLRICHRQLVLCLDAYMVGYLVGEGAAELVKILRQPKHAADLRLDHGRRRGREGEAIEVGTHDTVRVNLELIACQTPAVRVVATTRNRIPRPLI